MNHHTNNLRQTGFILLPVVLAISVLAALIYLLDYQGAVSGARFITASDNTQADYVAEAGLRHALWNGNQGACTGYALSATNFDGHSYQASFTPTSGSPVSITVNATTADGVSRSLSREQVALYQSPVSLLLQPDGATGKDLWITGSKPTWNYGLHDSLFVGELASHRALLEFDLSGVPSGAKIVSATLELYMLSTEVGTTQLHRVTSPWLEGSCQGASCVADGATWATSDGTTPWTTAGVDHDGNAAASQTHSVAGWYGWSIGGLVAQWVSNQTANYGVLMKSIAALPDFASSDDADPTRHPKLSIEYACECGVTCAGASKNLLFVSGGFGVMDMDSGAFLVVPTAQEQLRIDLIESWGYTVNLIDDDDSQAVFDTAVAANGVAYVSEQVDDAVLGVKLRNAGIGVVSEEVEVAAEFGFADDRILKTNSEVNIVDNTHYITSPLATGLLTILSSSQPVHILNRPYSPDLLTLGETFNIGSTYKPSLVVLNAGATLVNGGNTPARRVHLPWGGSAFDFSALNTAGQGIMQRAIEWAEGAGDDTAAPLTPFAHWQLDDATGLVALDSWGGHHGALTGGPAWTTGQVAGGLDFDGLDDYVDAGSFDVAGSGLTLLGWFNAEVIATDDGRMVSKSSGPNEGDAIWQLSSTDSGANRYLRMRIKAGGTTTSLQDASANLSTGQWYFAAATYDNASGDMRLYLDGLEVASGSHAVGGAVDSAPTVPVAIGANGTAERFFNGILDDVRVYDRPLSASEISDLYLAGGGSFPAQYIQAHETWAATTSGTWQAVDLSSLGVPADAVLEVAVTNGNKNAERTGGVRAVGSGLDRFITLHEPEGGGTDVVVMHVQADAASNIEHYASNTGDINFILLGWWVETTYSEAFQSFKAGADSSWVTHDLGAYGVGANQVADILVVNTDTGVEYSGGARSVGSALVRRPTLHEAEGGGVEAVTLPVNTNATASIEVAAQNNASIDFYLLGHWSTPPGSYTELGGVHWAPTGSGAWLARDLSGFGVPAEAVVTVTVANTNIGAERWLGLRETGSGLDRWLDIHEAEGGGEDLATWHVKVDDSAGIEYFVESTDGPVFYPMGYWVLP